MPRRRARGRPLKGVAAPPGSSPAAFSPRVRQAKWTRMISARTPANVKSPNPVLRCSSPIVVCSVLGGREDVDDLGAGAWAPGRAAVGGTTPWTSVNSSSPM